MQPNLEESVREARPRKSGAERRGIFAKEELCLIKKKYEKEI